MRKRRKQNKWYLLGLAPLAAGAAWLISRLRGRPIPRKRAMVPAEDAPHLPDFLGTRQPSITVTGTAPDVALAAEEQTGDQEGFRPIGNPPDNKDDLEVIWNAGASSRNTGTGFRNKEPRAVSVPGGHAARHQGETSNVESSEPDDLRAGHALRSGPSAERISLYVLLLPFVGLAVAIALLSSYQLPKQSPVVVPGGDPVRGQAALQSWGCGSCHTIPGVTGAYGKVGPDLGEVGMHSFVAGHLENTPENMVQWIMHPQQISPGNGMPDTGVAEPTARDMAAYLYSLSGSQRPGSGANSFQISR